MSSEDKIALKKALMDANSEWSAEKIGKRLGELRVLQNNCINVHKLSSNTRETLQISVDIAARTQLTASEKISADNYLKNMRKIAQAQISGKLPQTQIKADLTLSEMAKSLKEKEKNLTKISGAFLFDGDTPSILIGKNSKNIAASQIHETQHLIQYMEGKLVFSHGKPLSWTYDLQDEIEAYRIQYLFAPDSLPEAVTNIDDINIDYVRKLYPELPEQQLSLDSTLSEIDEALKSSNSKIPTPSTVCKALGYGEFPAKQKLIDFLNTEVSVIRPQIANFVKDWKIKYRS